MSRPIRTRRNEYTSLWSKNRHRIFWRKDPEFKELNNYMVTDTFNFEQMLQLSTFEKLEFVEDVDWHGELKYKWQELVDKWNGVRNIKGKDCVGFTALAFLIVVTPFKLLKNPGVFSQHEVEIFNRVYFYHTKRYLPFKGLYDLFDSGPLLPIEYREWLDDLYNSAAWWLTYILYEKVYGLEHIYATKPAELTLLVKKGPGDPGFLAADEEAARLEMEREARLREELRQEEIDENAKMYQQYNINNINSIDVHDIDNMDY